MQKIKRNLFGFLSFSTALFIFQACYGAPQDEYNDVLLEGKVISDSTGLPVKGIRIQVNSTENTAVSDSNGQFSFYIPTASQYVVELSDADSTSDGHFLSRDTVLGGIPESGVVLRMEEKL